MIAVSTNKFASPNGQVMKTAPSTPATNNPQTPRSFPVGAVSTPSPGTWEHPKFDEIARRQRLNNFDDSNVRRILLNSLALLLLFYLQFNSYLSPLTALIDAVITLPLPSPFNNPLIFLLTITFSYNIYASLLPLWRPKDEITDIPLTPTQRSLLGLNPNSTPSPTSGAPPATQGSNYITPPRYPRSPVLSPGSSRSGASASTGNTPASASRQSQRQSSSPLTLGLRESAMLESPMTSSPLWPKTRAAVALRRRNSSHSLGGTSVGPGTPSPLGQGIRGGGGGVGGGGEKASVGLNSKWLYERGRSSSGSMSGKSIYL